VTKDDRFVNDNVLSVAPILTVVDPQASAEWYRDKLGFDVLFVADNPGLPTYGVVCRGGAEIHLMSGERTQGYLSVDVVNVDVFFKEIEERGALPDAWPRHLDAIREHPPEDKGYGRRDMFLVTPDETILCVGHALDS
jgi:catechol 2,3-dioxygenase-like lactoylglutathione lyase family enzyme